MVDPALLILDLTGNGELIVLSRETFAIFYNDTSNADATEYGRRYSETFNQVDIPYVFYLAIKKPSFDSWAVMCLLWFVENR